MIIIEFIKKLLKEYVRKIKDFFIGKERNKDKEFELMLMCDEYIERYYEDVEYNLYRKFYIVSKMYDLYYHISIKIDPVMYFDFIEINLIFRESLYFFRENNYNEYINMIEKTCEDILIIQITSRITFKVENKFVAENVLLYSCKYYNELSFEDFDKFSVEMIKKVIEYFERYEYSELLKISIKII